ncbi:MAG: helix-turn-helix domain-containing protein, partial [Bacteroidota bacterium]
MKNLITKRESATREGIIAEALSLASEEGWKKVTVRAIASRLGYQPPVLYQFFKNKDDLIRSILLEG